MWMFLFQQNLSYTKGALVVRMGYPKILNGP